MVKLPLNRNLSQALTPWLAQLPLSPNQVTGLSLGCGLAAAWNFLQGTPAGWLWGALWFEASYILDNCDGELARMKGLISGLGSWIDLITDCFIHIAFFLSLAWGLARSEPEAGWETLGILAAIGVFLTYLFYVMGEVKKRGRGAWLHPDPPLEETTVSLSGRIKAVARGDFALVVLASAFVGPMAWLLWAGMVGAWVSSALGVLARAAFRS